MRIECRIRFSATGFRQLVFDVLGGDVAEGHGGADGRARARVAATHDRGGGVANRIQTFHCGVVGAQHPRELVRAQSAGRAEITQNDLEREVRRLAERVQIRVRQRGVAVVVVVRAVTAVEVVIVTGARRGEGTTEYYVAKNFSTVSDKRLVGALEKAAKEAGVRYHLGSVFTTDALFQETPELIGDIERQGIAAIDMVTSAFLTIAQVRGKRAAAIMAVSDECLCGKFGFRDPAFIKSEEKMVDIALKALRFMD